MIRIAMWSGPRNLSTALMRAFEARGDCAVSDEPLYGHYLRETGLQHPHREAILASLPQDPGEATSAITGPIPGDRPIWYQKHMAQHLLPTLGRAWLQHLRHAFLVRDPRLVVASYGRVRERFGPEELGFLQQITLIDHVTGTLGQPAVVVDSADILRDPAGTLERLCAALGLRWTPAMLSWPAGPRASDGVWAPAWYGNVESSTGFAPYTPRDVEVPARHRTVLEALLPAWERLERLRI